MPDNLIRIGDFAFHTVVGEPITFSGKHSGKILSGINVNFSVPDSDGKAQVDELCTCETVQVVDPFANRSYEALFRIASYSFQEGFPEYHYTAEIREVDITPSFQILEIDGHHFDVVKYIETEHENDAIGRHALLQLSKEQFAELQDLIKPGTVEIKRLGVDDTPLVVRYGGAMYWSEHEESGLAHYKHIIRFFPPDLPPIPTGLATRAEQEALANMVVGLSARFEALVKELAISKILSDEQRGKLLDNNWQDLLDATRIQEITLQTQKVFDAEENL